VTITANRLQAINRRLFSKLSADNAPNITNFVLLNARSVNNKLPELYNLIYSMHYSVIIVTESWLRSSTPDGLLDPNNQFTIIRCDRQAVIAAGGVCVFVSKLYNVAVINVAELYPELELCCFDLLRGDMRCRVFAIYRTPNSNNMQRLVECLNRFSDVKHTRGFPGCAGSNTSRKLIGHSAN